MLSNATFVSKAKENQKQKLNLISSLFDLLVLQLKPNVTPGITLLDIINEDLHLHLLVYAKSTQKYFKRTNKSLECE